MADLAVEHDDIEYPYKSTGAKEAEDPIRLDKGGGFKGTLHYKAEFIPALKLKGGVKFNEMGAPGLTKKPTKKSSDGSFESAGSKPDEEGQEVPDGVTISEPHVKTHTRGARSTDTTATAATSGTVGTQGTVDSYDKAPVETPEEEGVEMSKEELLAQREYSAWKLRTFEHT